MSILDIFDTDKLETQVLNIVKLLPKEFWEAEWSIRLQDSAAVRREIKDDLSTLLDNCKLGRSWHEDLNLPHPDFSQQFSKPNKI
jgi:hypothetical protein